MVTSARTLVLAIPPDIRRSAGAALRAAPFAAAMGVVLALLWPNHYLSTASFIAEAQNPRALPSTLGALADQFGIGAGMGGGQTPAFLADLLESRAILVPILDMATRTTGDSTPRPLVERLQVGGPERPDQEERALRKLRGMLRITPDIKTNVVSLGVDARDPQLAHDIAEALLASLDRFNVSVRRSRARNEREFLEGRVAQTQSDLQAAEGALEQFLSANRGSRTSPSLAFREARLQRQLELAQARFIELQRQLDQARVQEVRDTPAITVLDRPDLPRRHYRPRRSLVVLVILCGGMIGAYGLSRLGMILGPAAEPSGPTRS